MSLKIAVYAICKNEAKNVPLFTASANEADEICVLDTGSTDQSFRLLDNYCSIVQQTTFTPWKTIEEHDALIKEGKTPWRFDVARNMALGLVPIDIDICVICDLDERFEPGWRKKLEQIWESETTRLNVRYIFSRTAEGRPGIVYQMCRAHRRKGYEWSHPVHECLKWTGEGQEHIQDTFELELHHYQNAATSRAQYLPILELSTREDPADERNSHYLAREYMFTRQWEKCIAESKRHLALPKTTWEPEKAMSDSFIARSYEALGNPGEAERWFMRACADCDDRDHWVRLAQFYCNRRYWAGAYAAAMRALQYTQRPHIYTSDPLCWGSWPEELAAVGAYWLGLKAECKAHYDNSIALSPTDERLKKDRYTALQLLEAKT